MSASGGFAGVDPTTGEILEWKQPVAYAGMDIESGRVYLPDEYADRKARRMSDRHQAKFERQDALGKIIEVSDQVALQQLAGQEAIARKARRRAAKAARKRNR